MHVDHIGKGYASELAAALTKVAFEVVGVDRVEIRCDPHNVRSAAVPRKLGYGLEATLRRRLRDSARRATRHEALQAVRGHYPGSPSSKCRLRAFDAAGRRLL